MPEITTEDALLEELHSLLGEGEEEALGAVARSYLVQWAFGIRQFSWYAWDIYYDEAIDFVQLSYSITPHDFAGITPAVLSRPGRKDNR